MKLNGLPTVRRKETGLKASANSRAQSEKPDRNRRGRDDEAPRRQATPLTAVVDRDQTISWSGIMTIIYTFICNIDFNYLEIECPILVRMYLLLRVCGLLMTAEINE